MRLNNLEISIKMSNDLYFQNSNNFLILTFTRSGQFQILFDSTLLHLPSNSSILIYTPNQFQISFGSI